MWSDSKKRAKTAGVVGVAGFVFNIIIFSASLS
jgi:hypothetical protein